MVEAGGEEVFYKVVIIGVRSREEEDTVEEGEGDRFEGFREVGEVGTEGEGFNDGATLGGRVETVLHNGEEEEGVGVEEVGVKG